MHIIINFFRKMTYKQIILFSLLTLCFLSSFVFVNNNYSFYERPIAEVTKTDLKDTSKVDDPLGYEDYLYTQNIIAEVKNGDEKGRSVHLVNEYSMSKAYDHEFEAGDEIFISFDKDLEEGEDLTGAITDVKRDKYLLLVSWVFIFTLLLVGKKQGLFSIVSLVINALIISYALDVYVNYSHISLLLICSISVVLFTVLSLLLVNGRNEKTYAAIIATLLGTFLSLLITYLVMEITSEQGLRYEELQFITRPYHTVFLTGLFIGSLGAVMDVAITISSSLFGLYEKNNSITVKDLKKSGMEIGKDIMGTMTNILLFAYVSGSIPILILYFKNAFPLGLTLSLNLSLELARALAGGIGIVLTIPIGLYTTIFFINRKRGRV